jgi:antitoxin component of MazEF toxin-antitoxin module
MSALKLQKIGNSFGFRIPKETLDQLGFSAEDQYELIEERGSLVIVKRRPPLAQWTFREPDLSSEDLSWLEADLGEDPGKKK